MPLSVVPQLPKPDKRRKFLGVIEPRVERALHAIRVVAAVGGTNRYSYEYGPTDVDRIVQALTDEVDALEARMKRTPPQIRMKFTIEGD